MLEEGNDERQLGAAANRERGIWAASTAKRSAVSIKNTPPANAVGNSRDQTPSPTDSPSGRCGERPTVRSTRKKRDEAGIVASLSWGSIHVGTLRFVPLLRGLSPLDAMLERKIAPQLTRRSWEFGRLILDAGYRSGPELLGRCIFLAMRHLMRCTDAEHLFASCTPSLARLYRRYGMAVLDSSITVAEPVRAYCLIHGVAQDVLRASSRACASPEAMPRTRRATLEAAL